MARSVVDKIHAYLSDRAPEGVSAEELAREFLAPASAPAGLCEKLVSGLLASDPRFAKRADGLWGVPARAAAEGATGAFTVVEVTEARAAARSCILECAVCRVDAQGRVGAVKGTAIRPEPWPQDLIVPPELKEKLRGGTTLEDAVERTARFASGSTIVAWRTEAFQAAAAGRLAGAAALSLEALSRRLLGAGVRTPEQLAAKLQIPFREAATTQDRARFTAELLAALLARRESLPVADPEGWVEAQRPPRMEFDFSPYEFDRAFIESLPQRPGIYVMREASGRVIYVGKARNLRARVKPYFRARIESDEKIERILERLSRLEIVETGSELAALLAEQAAIREHRPPINIQYEVHERLAAEQAHERRLALVLSAPAAEEAELFLLHGDTALRRAVVRRDDPAGMRPLLSEFFFAAPPARAEGADREALEIAWSWLDRHADRVNAFDVDVAGGLDPSLRLLERYLREEPHRKVFHV
jgi:hypothetical protein